MELSWYKLFIFTLIPFSDFFLRVFYLRGTIDHIWTLFPIFQIPLFNVVPLLMMKFKIIKNGKLNESPFDIFVFLFLIFSYFIKIAASCGSISPGNRFMADFIGTYFAILLPFIIRSFHPKKPTCNPDKTKNALFKTLGQSGVIYLAAVIILLMLPKVRPFTELIGESNAFFLFYMFSYVLCNMWNENNVKTYCGFQDNSLYTLIVGGVCLLVAGKLKHSMKYADMPTYEDLVG